MPLNENRRNMHLIRRLPEASDRATAVAIGNFDGLHLGHQAVVKAMTMAATKHNVVPSVLTFEPHPRRFFAKGTPAFRLERLRDKFVRLRNHGVERVLIPRFDAAFASMPAEQFLNQVLARQIGAKAVITGEDFAFGHKRGGDSALLKEWGRAQGVEIITVPPVMVAGRVCSSSAVRAAITGGDMALAAQLLGRTYSLTGRVVHGDGRGRTIGFPTANVALPPDQLPLAYGVYAVFVTIDNATYKGVANFGIRPTVGGGTRPSLEVYLFDFMQVIYGKTLQVALVKQLRTEMKFDGIEALKRQIETDCTTARAILEAI